MGNSKTTIELNGKQYDARTGKIIADNVEVNPVNSNHAKPQSSPSQVLDGFVRRPSKTQQPKQILKSAPKDSRTSINHAKRSVTKSKALMRPAVQKPTDVKNDIQKLKYIPKPSHAEAVRISRAHSTDKSPMVTKFGGNSITNSIKKSIAHLPVVNAPVHHNSVNKVVNNELDRFEQALKKANSHMHQLEKDAIKKVPFLKTVGFKNRTANLATMSFAFLLLVGFFAYQNSALLSIQVASHRAGISAKMPNYVPAGYGANRTANAGDGKVSLAFHSNTDNKSFTLTQQASSWNSSSLLSNHVQKRNCTTCYQTWQNEGKTVYIYDNSNATWVDGGIWYQIEGNASLTSDQLLRLAKSL